MNVSTKSREKVWEVFFATTWIIEGIWWDWRRELFKQAKQANENPNSTRFLWNFFNCWFTCYLLPLTSQVLFVWWNQASKTFWFELSAVKVDAFAIESIPVAVVDCSAPAFPPFHITLPRLPSCENWSNANESAFSVRSFIDTFQLSNQLQQEGFV